MSSLRQTDINLQAAIIVTCFFCAQAGFAADSTFPAGSAPTANAEAKGLDNSLGTATALDAQAEASAMRGDIAKAESLLLRSLKIYEANDRAEKTAETLNNLGILFQMTDIAKARGYFESGIAFCEKKFGLESPVTANAMVSLAGTCLIIQDYSRAETLLRQALAIYTKAFGENHILVAQNCVFLASARARQNDTSGAHALTAKALQIYERTEVPPGSRTADCLNNLGYLLQQEGKGAEAEPAFERALAIYKTLPFGEMPATVVLRLNLAALYQQRGDTAKAEQTLREDLAISRKVFGEEHEQTTMVMNNLAFLCLDQSKTNEASQLGQRLARLHDRRLSQVLSFSSERQRLDFQLRDSPYTIFARLGDSAALAQTVLRNKGIVLDSILEDHLLAKASKDPEIEKIVLHRQALLKQLVNLSFQSGSPGAVGSAPGTPQPEAVRNDLEQCEQLLAQKVLGQGQTRRALGVTLANIQAALPADSILIEWICYLHYLAPHRGEWRYGAVLIPSPSVALAGHRPGEPVWVSIGTAKTIDLCIARYKAMMSQLDDDTILHDLYARLFAPLKRLLPSDVRNLIISPDGEVNFVSFATLAAADDRFLAEDFSFSYVSSGRDLLRTGSGADGSHTIQVFANPDYRSPHESSESHREAASPTTEEQRFFGSISLKPLPSLEEQAHFLKAHAIDLGVRVEILTGESASEERLHEKQSPWILHFATHGFLFPQPERLENPFGLEPDHGTTSKGVLATPMNRSGLVLARAQSTFDAWSRGQYPPPENDGVLTANEVALLDLHGTWLVVLSACDTGKGEERAGEGVFGLRRAFAAAGAQNVLLTISPARARAANQLLEDFYPLAIKTRKPAEALSQVQRDWLVRFRERFGIVTAARYAGPFILNQLVQN